MSRTHAVWFAAAALVAGAGVSAPAQPPPAAAYTLDDLTRCALARHPRLAQGAFRVEAARGRAVQAGLYPNPTVAVIGDELGDRQGPGGIWTAPQVSQELVTGGKLSLSRSAATREADQAALAVASLRYGVLGGVRAAYADVLALQRRVALYADMVKLAEQSVEQTRKLFEANLAARLDLNQLELELERLRAEKDAAEGELPAAFRRLVAAAGASDLPAAALAGTVERLPPAYELEPTLRYVVGVHPDVRAAKLGVERATLLVRRAQAEPIPNVTVSTGYVRQNQNRSNDWLIGLSVPVPVWNRNQGNVAAAQAELGEAVAEVARVENELADRVAAAFREFAPARRRAERYRTAILPKAEETYDLSVRAYKGGQFEYLRVLQAQRALTEAYLEYVRALGEAWRAAGVISGLTLEDVWPPPP